MGGGGGGYFSGPPSRQISSGNTPDAPPAPKSEADPTSSNGPRTGGTGGGGAGGTPDPCAIKDEGVLRSPAAAVVAALRNGMDLDVVVRDVGGVKVLVAVAAGGATAGVIDCEREQELLDCIEQGNSYVARVTLVRGGTVSVSIRRVSSR